MESEYVYLNTEPGSDLLLVAFSHVGYPSGKFAFTNAFSHIKCNKLFINCPGNSWYQAGIPGLGDNIYSSARALHEIISSMKMRRTVFVGMSMGGYAALLYGLLTETNIILSFTAEIMIGEKNTRSISENNIKIFDPFYSNLSSLIFKNKNTQIFSIYGEQDLIDLSLLWPLTQVILKKEKLNLFMMEGGHQCTLKLNVPNIVQQLLVNGWLGPNNIDPVQIRDYEFSELEFSLYRSIKKLIDEENYKELNELLFRHHEIVTERPLLKIIKETSQSKV